MKKLLLSTAAIATLALSAGMAQADSDSATATASVTVVAPSTITNIDGELDFGTVYSGTATSVGDSISVELSGEAGVEYDITINGADASEGYGVAMELEHSDSSVTDTITVKLKAPASGSFDASTGEDDFTVAGTLYMTTDSIEAGDYSGDYTIEIAYQ